MKKILIATPMLPPTLGGPGIHAAKLCEYFSASEHWNTSRFVFEKLNIYPPGVRHIVAFLQILKKSKGADVILALDAFSVALPAVLAASLTHKKIILRIGGDLVHEQYSEKKAVDMEGLYNKLDKKQISLGISLKIKLCIQRYVIKNSTGIIFTSSWQKNIYEKYYSLPKNIWVVQNPYEDIYIEENVKETQEKVFISASRDVAFKNLRLLKKVFKEAQKINSDIILDTEISDREKLLERMSKAHCYVNISFSDISPNTVLDAISLKLPVILTKNTGFYDILKYSGVCRFVDPFEQEDIKTAILEMCDEGVYATYKSKLVTFKWPQTWQTLYIEYEKVLSDILK